MLQQLPAAISVAVVGNDDADRKRLAEKGLQASREPLPPASVGT